MTERATKSGVLAIAFCAILAAAVLPLHSDETKANSAPKLFGGLGTHGRKVTTTSSGPTVNSSASWITPAD